MKHLKENQMEKNEESSYPGTILAPWAISFTPPEAAGFNPFDISGKNAYDIIKVKEFIRRKKIMSRYAEKPINKALYSVLDISKINVSETDTEIIMDVDLSAKQALKDIKFKMDFKYR